MHRSDPAPLILATFCRWLMVCCVLFGLCGQLLLQSNALPDEAPRVTFERLTGLHIGPGQPSTMPPMHHADGAMPGMMSGMTHTGKPDPSGHHHDGSCPLCPLLHLPAVIFSVAFIAALILIAWSRSSYSALLPRAPPVYALAFRPPPTGPPAFL
ncbi:DUF2946 family protein [Acetobacter orleanensis]|uniref:DUF2946 domain-containing protein n=1 Tax=Acetobacter orleanensis TaxID=104099 RepID=A0A4Y3TQA1_9PROT|nr:DUF2946 family protein [Acetobacter orleanensis]KXV66869.1 hypothetical protein AD949_01250 [Acetobacter orleanensis]PCD78403.1 DUF2946 domain-containing protein [Acetobacter orleanensis]GAN69332.1 hypothetical protein Abol_031_006 [Acetobacter orleanensis JCM 7639]GEB83954.1 hypothetical protein AOR01nite_24310 [Acetobacter orleanensis]